MAEDDVDDLLEEAFKNIEEADKNGKKMDDVIMKKAKEVGIKQSSDGKRKSSRSRSGSRDRKRKRSRTREKKRDSPRDERKKRSRSPDDKRSRRRSSSRDRRRRSRSRSYERSRRSSPPRRRSRSPWEERRRSPAAPARRQPGPERRDVLDSLSMPFNPRRSPPPDAKMDMTSEERDERTIFILQLARQTRPRDLEEFFSSVGHVRDVRIITDTKTRRSKGIAYVEFWERDAVPLAMGLSGQKLNGAPLIIQMSCAERNRAANTTTNSANTIGLGLGISTGPLKVKVSNLHPNITDEMLAAIFEPFGRVERCYIQKDPMDLSNSMGYVTFRHGEEGRRAMEQLNGFELAGRNICVTSVDEEELVKTEEPKKIETQQGSLEAEDRNINSSSRLQLMANLAKGKEDVKVPKITQEAIATQQAHQQNADNIPTFATQCFMLSNMFGPSNETEAGWDLDIRDDVIEECKTHGVIVQETQEEVAARNAHQREKRKKSLTEQFEKMHQQTNIQDYQSSFANKFDCIQRLLPFGLFIEPEFGHDFLYKFDAEIQRHSELMLERQKSIEKRIQSIMFRQAMAEMETEQNLLLFLDGYYIKEQFGREIIEKDPTYLDKVEHLVDTSNCKPELDWEFNEWSPDLYTNIPPFTPPIQEQEQQQTHIPGGSIEHLVDTSNCKPAELDWEFNEWSPELIQPFTPPIQEQEQQQTHIPGGSMLKLRISKQMLQTNNSTRNIQQIEEKKEERKARKKRKRETKKRKIVIERDEMKDDEIKEEEPIMKIPRIKIRLGNSIKHKDPQQQQPSPTILSTIPSTSSIMTPLFASQTFEEPPQTDQKDEMELKLESKRVQFSPSCSENDPVGSMLKLRISKQMLHENSTSNIQIEEKKEERKARKKRKRERKKKKIVIERDEMKDDEIKEEEPIMKIPRIKIRFGNSVKHKDPEQQPSPTIFNTIPSTSSIMTPLFASQTFDEPPQTDQKDGMELKLESKRVQFSPCCSEDESESELRQRTDKLLSRIDRLHC